METRRSDFDNPKPTSPYNLSDRGHLSNSDLLSISLVHPFDPLPFASVERPHA